MIFLLKKLACIKGVNIMCVIMVLFIGVVKMMEKYENMMKNGHLGDLIKTRDIC